MLTYFSSSYKIFIHSKLAKVLNWFKYLALEFQVMIAYGGTINFLGKFHNIDITMGEHVLKSWMIAILMGGIDVALGV